MREIVMKYKREMWIGVAVFWLAIGFGSAVIFLNPGGL